MSLPILYSFRRCPYAMRARMAIASSGVEVELREVVLRDKPGHMLAMSPKGTVPVLILPDGSVLEESRDIIDWALDQNDPEGWKPVDLQQAELEAWVAENDGSFKEDLDHYKYSVRFPEQSMEDYRQKGEVFLRKLDETLTRQAWLAGEQPGVADISVFPFIRQFAFVDKSWFDQTPYAHLHSWLTHFLESDVFATAMKKFPQWQPGQSTILFP